MNVPWLLRVSLAVGFAQPAAAQAVPFSQHGTVSQTVGRTVITITYNRPVARGRTLFGPSGVVKWDQVWHPGADSATRIKLSRDLIFEGKPVPKGEYSMWLIPREVEPWTLILSRAARVFHQPYPGEASDCVRVLITPQSGEHMETLAYYFPVVGRDSTVMRLHWGTTVLPVRLRTP